MAPFPFLLMLFVGQAMEFRSALFGVFFVFGVSEYSQARHSGNMYLFFFFFMTILRLRRQWNMVHLLKKKKVFSIIQKQEIGIKVRVMEWST